MFTKAFITVLMDGNAWRPPTGGTSLRIYDVTAFACQLSCIYVCLLNAHTSDGDDQRCYGLCMLCNEATVETIHVLFLLSFATCLNVTRTISPPLSSIEAQRLIAGVYVRVKTGELSVQALPDLSNPQSKPRNVSKLTLTAATVSAMKRRTRTTRAACTQAAPRLRSWTRQPEK